jgi:two-component system cell cycle response regulator CtrA
VASAAPLAPSARTILIIEDEASIAAAVAARLRSEGFSVEVAADGPIGVERCRELQPDLVVLDLMLPGLDGLEVCEHIQAERPVPVLMLTARDSEQDLVVGLGVGADDYMTKPFHKDELVARIHAIVRRSKGHAQSVIQTGDLVVNLDTKTVEVGGQRVHLTGKEYQMLELLSLRKGTTLTKEMFLNHLYGGMDEPELKIIDVFICKLRKKLANASEGRNFIETVWGRGYVLREPHEDDVRIPA